MDWIKIGKGVSQGCLFNWYEEYIIWNTGLDEAQTGVKIARRNINNLKYADDTTLMAERNEPPDEGDVESEKFGLKLNIQKSKTGLITSSGSITSRQIDGETMETDRLYFLGLQNHCGQWR